MRFRSLTSLILYAGFVIAVLLVSFTDPARYILGLALIPVWLVCFPTSPVPKGLGFTILVSLIPPLFAFIQGEDFSRDMTEHWINHRSSLIPLVAFLWASLLLQASKSLSNSSKLAKHYSSYMALALLILFLVDFIYSIFSFMHGLNNSDNRFEGSAGNPQPWAVELAIYLLIYIVFRKSILRDIKVPKYIFDAFPFLIALAMILSGSISNILWLILASLAFLLPARWALVTGISVLALAHYEVFLFIQHFNGDFSQLKSELGSIAHKFIPRIKVWYSCAQALGDIEWNHWLGLGFSKYSLLLKENTDTNHLHNIFYHNFILYGYSGLLMPFLVFFTNAKNLLSNKIYLAVFLYVLCSSSLDPAFQCFGPLFLFFFSLPFIIDLSRNRP